MFGVYREGLSTRAVGGSDEIQLRIDPMHADFDDEITGLRTQVKKLRHVCPLLLSHIFNFCVFLKFDSLNLGRLLFSIA